MCAHFGYPFPGGRLCTCKNSDFVILRREGGREGGREEGGEEGEREEFDQSYLEELVRCFTLFLVAHLTPSTPARGDPQAPQSHCLPKKNAKRGFCTPCPKHPFPAFLVALSVSTTLSGYTTLESSRCSFYRFSYLPGLSKPAGGLTPKVVPSPPGRLPQNRQNFFSRETEFFHPPDTQDRQTHTR